MASSLALKCACCFLSIIYSPHSPKNQINTANILKNSNFLKCST
jgi:hypothetical protein